MKIKITYRTEREKKENTHFLTILSYPTPHPLYFVQWILSLYSQRLDFRYILKLWQCSGLVLILLFFYVPFSSLYFEIISLHCSFLNHNTIFLESNPIRCKYQIYQQRHSSIFSRKNWMMTCSLCCGHCYWWHQVDIFRHWSRH